MTYCSGDVCDIFAGTSAAVNVSPEKAAMFLDIHVSHGAHRETAFPECCSTLTESCFQCSALRGVKGHEYPLSVLSRAAGGEIVSVSAVS